MRSFSGLNQWPVFTVRVRGGMEPLQSRETWSSASSTTWSVAAWTSTSSSVGTWLLLTPRETDQTRKFHLWRQKLNL